MGTVYVTQDDSFISKVDERLNVKFEKKVILDVPLIKVDGLVVMGRASISLRLFLNSLTKKFPSHFLLITVNILRV